QPLPLAVFPAADDHLRPQEDEEKGPPADQGKAVHQVQVVGQEPQAQGDHGHRQGYATDAAHHPATSPDDSSCPPVSADSTGSGSGAAAAPSSPRGRCCISRYTPKAMTTMGTITGARKRRRAVKPMV